MRYYIKAIGIRKEGISIFEGRFAKMLLYKMCFKNVKGKVKELKKGDKLVIYCIRNAVKEFPRGGFIGAQVVVSDVYEDPFYFGNPWIYVVDIKPEFYSFKNIVYLDDVKNWQNKTEKLKRALSTRCQAIGGLLKIDKQTFCQFIKEFSRKIG